MLFVPNNQLHARSIIVIPISEISFDKSSYELTQAFAYTYFKMGVPSDMAEGVYNISWQIIESPLVSDVFLYETSFKTIVKVHAGDAIEVNIYQVTGVPNGLMSYPISLDLGPYTPYHYINIQLSVFNPSLFIEPTQIIFSPDNNKGYYQLIFNNNNTIQNGTVFYVFYTLTGVDINTFAISQNTSIVFQSVITYPQEINDTQIYIINQVSADINLYITSPAILTWAFGPSDSFLNSFYYSLTYITRYAYPLFSQPTIQQFSINDQVDNFKSYLNSISNELDWANYQISLKKAAVRIFFGRDFYEEGPCQLFIPDVLMANTNYTLVV